MTEQLFEIRETAGREPEITGILLQEGRIARRRKELFAPGAICWPSEGVEIRTRHRVPGNVRGHPVRDRNGTIRITARATPEIEQAVRSGKAHMSIEFHALEQRFNESGVREINRAIVPSVALVARPEYIQTRAEIRESDYLERRARAWL